MHSDNESIQITVIGLSPFAGYPKNCIQMKTHVNNVSINESGISGVDKYNYIIG